MITLEEVLRSGAELKQHDRILKYGYYVYEIDFISRCFVKKYETLCEAMEDFEKEYVELPKK